MNRTIDGDLVVVELLPEDQWEAPSFVFIDVDAPELSVVDAVESGSASTDTENQLLSASTKGQKTTPPSLRKPTGRIVGVIKRNWRPVCGTIEWDESMKGSKHKDYVLFVPINRRIPKIKVKTKQPHILQNNRIVVCIDGT